MKLASVASNRLEILFGRIVGSALVLNGLEPLLNGLGQLGAMNLLGKVMLVAFGANCLIAGISGWTRFAKPAFISHGITVMVILVLTPQGFSEYLGDEQRPWVWWALGLAAVFFGMSTKGTLRFSFVVAMAIGWILVFGLGMGGLHPDLAILDAVYLVVFALAIIALTDLVRASAARVDDANSDAIAGSLKQARVDAIERERQRLDALVHDQVLHSLLLAAKADSSAAQESASVSAQQALNALATVADERPQTASSMGLCQALAKAAAKLDRRIETEIVGADSVIIPADVAEAITEATLQAVDNAIQHSRAKTIRLQLRATRGDLDFVVSDNGEGFRLDRVSRNRIGIKTSIQDRMHYAGGQVEIDTAPGMGTKVRLRWSNA